MINCCCCFLCVFVNYCYSPESDSDGPSITLAAVLICQLAVIRAYMHHKPALLKSSPLPTIQLL